MKAIKPAWVITTLALLVFGGTQAIVARYSNLFMGILHCPINAEVRPGDTASGRLQEVSPTHYAGDTVCLWNGTGTDQMAFLEHVGRRRVDAVLVGKADRSKPVLGSPQSLSSMDSNRVQVQNIVIPERKPLWMTLLSSANNPERGLGEDVRVQVRGKDVQDGVVLSNGEAIAYAIALFFVGYMVSWPAARLKELVAELRQGRGDVG